MRTDTLFHCTMVNSCLLFLHSIVCHTIVHVENNESAGGDKL